MNLDTTSCGICFGIIGSIIFACVEFHKCKDFDVKNIALIFLAIFAISSGGELIYSAIQGDKDTLPDFWREYIAVAGMVGIGLSLNFVINAFKSIYAQAISE